MSSSVHSLTVWVSSMSRDAIQFDPNGLYILISDIGSDIQFHWALYLAATSHHGMMFHMIWSIETGHKWQYQVKSIMGTPNSLNLLVALKIATMEPALHAALTDRLALIPHTAPITCRLWLKRALHDLDEEGYIQLTGKVDEIEQEALTEAAENQPRRIRTSMRSRYCIV